MSKTKKFFFFILALGLYLFAGGICFAQTSAPGDSSSSSLSPYDVLKQQQQSEDERLDTGSGSDSGENYGISDAYNDAAYDAQQDIENADGFWGKAWNRFTYDFKVLFNTMDNLKNTGKDVYTYTDPTTGETIEYVKTIWGGAVATKGTMKDCPPVPIAIVDASSCTFCPLFAVLYAAAQQMTELSFDKLAKSIATVMAVGFAIYIAFKVLAHVSSFTRQDAPKFINELLVQTFKVVIAFLLLMNRDQIYHYFITPVLGAGLEFGNAMLFNSPDFLNQCVQSVTITNDTSTLPTSLYVKLDCFIRSVQMEISVAQAIGSSLMCVGRHAATDILGFWDFSLVFQGLFIWAFAIMLSLAFAFYLIDAVVTLGLVGALMPFLIACWPFKLTTGYSKKGIEMCLNVVFTFIFIGIVVSINLQLVGQALTGGNTATAAAPAASSDDAGTKTDTASTSTTKTETTTTETSTSSTSTAPTSSDTAGGLNAIINAMAEDNVEVLREVTDIGFGGFLILLFCCIFGFKFTSQATQLASKMSGGGISGIGSQIGGMAAKGASDLAKKATQPARKAVADKANELTGKAGAAIGQKLGLGKYGGKTGNKGGAGGGSGGSGGAGGDKGGAGGDKGGAGGDKGGAGGDKGGAGGNSHADTTQGQDLNSELNNRNSSESND